MDLDINDDLVIAAAFRKLDDETWAALISDEHIVAFSDRTRLLNKDLGAQIAVFVSGRQAGEAGDSGWYHRLVGLNRRVSALARYLGPLRQAWQVRQGELKKERRKSRLFELREAIQQHQERVLREYDPTDADLALWEVIEDLPEQGDW